MDASIEPATPQTSRPPQPETSTPSTPPPKLSWLVWVLGILIVAVISSIATYLLLTNKPTQQKVAAPTMAVSPSPTPDPTANWKTYTDTKQMYSIKYPSDWTVFPNIIGGVLSGYNGTVINSASQLEPHGETLAENGQAGIAVNVVGIDKSPNETLVEYQMKHLNILGHSQTYYSTSTLNGMNVLKHIRTNDEIDAGQPIYVLVNNNIIYQINVSVKNSSYASIVDQILSTLKFADQTSEVDTSSWKTYTNTLHKYEVKYPMDFPPSNNIGNGETQNSVIFGCNGEGYCLPPYYISVMSYPAGSTRDFNIYNSLSQSTLDKVFALSIGGELDQETTYDIGGKWNFSTKYKRLNDEIVNGESFLVIENPKWYGGSDRRLFAKKNNKVYMLGSTYQTETQLKTFKDIYSTFKFL